MPFVFDLPSLIELFEESPEISETDDYTFTVHRDGLTLELSVFSNFGDIYFTIRRDGVDFPIIDSKYEGCVYLKSVNFPNGFKAAQLGLKPSDTSKGADHQEVIQIFTYPNFGVRHILK